MPIDDALREELLAMAAEDQDARLAGRRDPYGSPAVTRMVAVDDRDLARFREIVSQHGWPGSSLVGEDGARAAWLLAQHADFDIAFQRRCLELLEAAVDEGEASRADLAYLTDRVLVHEGRPQRFGTQFTQVGESLEPQPIEDEERVDERRLDVGLPPLSASRQTMEAQASRWAPAPHHSEVLEEAPEPLPARAQDALGHAAALLPDVLAVYFVVERRTWSDGRSQRVRRLLLVVRDAPHNGPVPSDHTRSIVAEMAAALTSDGEQVDVAIGLAAPQFLRDARARGSLLWSRDSP